MAALVCEICGGKLMGRPGGVFECDSCGMEYDTAWAKSKIQEIKGTVQVEGTVEVTGTVKVEGPIKVEGGVNAENLLKRGQLALEDGKWTDASKFFDEVLNLNAECAEAYLGKVCAKKRVSSADEFLQRYQTEERVELLKADADIQKALRFADPQDPMGLSRRLDAIIRQDRECRAQDLEQRKQAKEQLSAVREKLAPLQGLIAAGSSHSVGVCADGTVVASGDNKKGQCNVADWRNIVAVAAGSSHTVGLKADGTVVTTGENDHGQCNVQKWWKDIVAVAAGSSHTAALRRDGIVGAVGQNEFGQCDVQDWRDIVAIAADDRHTVGLKADGTVVIAGECTGADQWKEIAAVAAAYKTTIGLQKDGTVVVCGNNVEAPDDWRNVVAISGGSGHLVGLCADGTVCATVWTPFNYGQGSTGEWKDIVAVAAGSFHTIGLRADGTVVVAGSKTGDKCNVAGWKLFNSIDTLEQERVTAVAQRAEQDRVEAKARRVAELEYRRSELQAELPSLKGLFSGKRRKEIETRIAQIDAELGGL